MKGPGKGREDGDREASPSVAILVVDDESLVRRSVVGCLADAGHRVLEAPGGAEAIEILQSLPGAKVGLVLLDVTMPGMGGIDVLKHVRRSRPELRVVMLTAEREGRVRREAESLGAYDFLEKPPSLEALVRVVRHAVEALRLEEEIGVLRAAVPAPRPNDGPATLSMGLPAGAEACGDPLACATIQEARDGFERLFLLRRLADHRGSVARTARAIGMDRTSLYRKIRLYGLDLTKLRPALQSTSSGSSPATPSSPKGTSGCNDRS